MQTSPLWIIFAFDMYIRLNQELLVNSFKTLDGRGANIHIAGGACITLQFVSNVIIHNLHIHDCVPSGNAIVRSSPTHAGFRGRSDGDGISIYAGRDIWIDHCDLSNCADGLIDAIMGSTAITISNCYFSRHNEVMLMGHRDDYLPDSGMQITIAFNRFGEKLVQRMPRCRRGYFHIVNNDYTEWEMYAIGGSANPTINSQGNRYRAPPDPNAKEVTKRIETDEEEWKEWNWRTEGDMLVNGAYFVPSGEGSAATYEKASSLDPKSAQFIDQLTCNAGVLGSPRIEGRACKFPGFVGQVTKRIETDEEEWKEWNWRTEGDMLVNGAYFVPSGEGSAATYEKASSLDPKSAQFIDQLTCNAGVLGSPRYPFKGLDDCLVIRTQSHLKSLYTSMRRLMTLEITPPFAIAISRARTRLPALDVRETCSRLPQFRESAPDPTSDREESRPFARNHSRLLYFGK
ncbi:probable pectate lyase 12 [Phalaenopsis equestris]|uniref:probable pectate lyase 12 n=1 Tax=Phalaenopsis equestris TaxID=78828 RepID=UPI0009E60D66|nr:probable pectate lyase 12 [Phalaenopsis equestris]